MLHILLVEDNPADAEMLQMALRKTGVPLDVVLIDDGVKAWQYLEARGHRQCDIVLLDLNLPRLSGFEVLDRIRASDSLKCLPVIVMSGSVDAGDISRCYRAGANSYICKPAHLAEILVAAENLVSYWSNCAILPSKSPVGVESC